MADMLSIGSVATNTFKKALDVTSHNVANVGTEGYSRQRAEIVSNAPSIAGAFMTGGGSRVSSVDRVHADYLQSQLLTGQAMVERYDSQLSLAKQVEGVIASNDQGVQEFMQRFFDALHTVSDNPTSDSSRQLLLDEAGNLESHIENVTAVLADTQFQVNNQLKDLTQEVNNRLETVKTINEQVEASIVNGTQLPNDLLDQRDQAILELSQYIDIKSFPKETGRIDIHMANGKLPLLSDNSLTKISAELSPYLDENRTEIYMSIGGQKTVVSDQITGGQIGGILDFRENMLDRAQNDLGVTLNGFVAAMNWQHYQGYDMNDDAGQSVFTPLTMDALGRMGNSEDGADIVVSFNPTHSANPPYTPATQPATYAEKSTDFQNAMHQIGELASREYEIRANGTDYSFFDYKTGEELIPTDLGGNVYQLEGLEFNLSGQANVAGDYFLIKPHQQMLKDFEKEINDTDLIATRGQAQLADYYNATWDDDGNGSVSYHEFLNYADSDADGVLQRSEVETLIGAGVDASVLDTNSDAEISYAEFSLIGLSAPSPAADGDNVNIANMASLQSAKLLFSGDNGDASETLLGGYSKMSTNVGMYVRGTDIQLTAQSNTFEQLLQQRDSISGVSLDEEAANLMRFQQAYEAAAQIISTSQTIFQTLLGAVRG